MLRVWLTATKVSKYGVFSGLYSPVFQMNAEIYGVNLHIQSEYRKMRITNSVFGHFLRNEWVLNAPLMTMIRSDAFYEMLCLNEDKGYGHQIWGAEKHLETII